jgi:hypothetical protein
MGRPAKANLNRQVARIQRPEPPQDASFPPLPHLVTSFSPRRQASLDPQPHSHRRRRPPPPFTFSSGTAPSIHSAPCPCSSRSSRRCRIPSPTRLRWSPRWNLAPLRVVRSHHGLLLLLQASESRTRAEVRLLGAQADAERKPGGSRPCSRQAIHLHDRFRCGCPASCGDGSRGDDLRIVERDHDNTLPAKGTSPPPLQNRCFFSPVLMYVCSSLN